MGWIKKVIEKIDQPREPFECPHDDSLCRKYGCPDDPNWHGDGCK